MDRVVVVFKGGVKANERAAARRAAHAVALKGLGREQFQLVRPQAGQSVAATIAALSRDPSVQSAERDRYMQAQSVPNDPLFGQLWGLRNVGQNVGGVTGGLPGADTDAVLAWDRTVGDPSVVVEDIDTGYRFDDPDLGPVAWTNPGEIAGDGIDNDHNGYIDDTRGWDAIGWKPTPVSPLAPDNDPTDARILDDGHGVHTAGTIGAQGNNGVGVTGVAQNVRIMPFRAGDAMGFPTSAIVEGINYAGRNGARVANMSFTGYFRSGALEAALGANPQVLFVAAAGNDTLNADGGGVPPSPCAINPAAPDATTGYTPPAGAIDNVVCAVPWKRVESSSTARWPAHPRPWPPRRAGRCCATSRRSGRSVLRPDRAAESPTGSHRE